MTPKKPKTEPKPTPVERPSKMEAAVVERVEAEGTPTKPIQRLVAACGACGNPTTGAVCAACGN